MNKVMTELDKQELVDAFDRADLALVRAKERRASPEEIARLQREKDEAFRKRFKAGV
jgi:hypothetical protein